VRFKGEERNVLKCAGVSGLDVLAILAPRGNAVTDVAKEVEVLNFAGRYVAVSPVEQFVKFHCRMRRLPLAGLADDAPTHPSILRRHHRQQLLAEKGTAWVPFSFGNGAKPA
jgi:hypothetical protein